MPLQIFEYVSSSHEGNTPWKVLARVNQRVCDISRFWDAQWKTYPYTFRTFHNIRCLLIYNISRGKRLANIFGYKNSNSLLKVSLLEPAWSPAKYSYSLSLQPLIYAFLSKRHLEEVFIFSYQLLISEFGACSFSFWGVCFCFFKYQIFFHFIGFENGQKKPKRILYFQFYVVFCIFVLKFSHKSNAILFLN